MMKVSMSLNNKSEPITDEQIAELIESDVEFYWSGDEVIRPLISRIQLNNEQLLEMQNRFNKVERERDEAVAYLKEMKSQGVVMDELAYKIRHALGELI